MHNNTSSTNCNNIPKTAYQHSHIATRAIDLATYICQHKSTVRQASIAFDISKSTVHKDISHRLKSIDPKLHTKVKKILAKNLAERHLRGGIATKNRYLKIKLK
ncbi:MAG: sporulation transcriptional regulator SpoIIID [Clostridiales bacterium]|jgi:putative DeoR family transcriptional regulator (stage III sporulation protein D)|nr:sporulation transcriptional regulator SpoIIID [Clostridiales bacterium]